MRKAAPQAPEVPACGAFTGPVCWTAAWKRACSANMCSYVAGQHGRNKPFYQDYSFCKEYMSVGNAEA